MEITKENFLTELPTVLNAIDEADFMSFDCEFSGIGEGASMILPFDTPSLVYQKAKTNLTNYTVVQFGLCTFRYDANKQKFLHRVFNFYVFPRVPERLAGSLRKFSASYQQFGCQADSLEFLAAQQFNFNKWIYQGVGFLRKSTLDSLKEEIGKKFKWQSKSERVFQPLMKIPNAHKTKVNGLIKQVDDFCKDESKKNMTFQHLQRFEKRMLINLSENKYGTSLYFDHQVTVDKEHILVVKKCNDADEYKEHSKQKFANDIADMDGAAGFCQVIMAISDSKKPIVGHNMYLDLLQTLKTFCCELPLDYSEFKKISHAWFPQLLDTKVMAAQPLFKKHFGFANSLYDLYKHLEKPPFCPIMSEAAESAYSYQFNVDNQHEAGYDALLTGLCFIAMSNYWGFTNNRHKRTSNDIPWDLVQPLINKITPGRVIDMAYFNMDLSTDADSCPDRSFVFHLSFPYDNWTNEHITDLFSPYGAIQIAWINSGSCFITLKDRTQIKSVITNLIDADHEDRSWKVKPADEFFKDQEKLIVRRLKREETLDDTHEDLHIKKMKLNGF